MKTIIATVASAAAITVAGVAGAQELSNGGGMSPYVGIEHTTAPGDGWWDGNASTEITVGATADLPWGLALDGSVGIVNGTDAWAPAGSTGGADSSAWDLGGFAIGGAGVTVSYEMANGMVIYSTTAFDSAWVRESTSVGAKWSF